MAATGLLGVHLISALGPKKALHSYGVKDPAPETIFVAQLKWKFFLACSLSSCLLHVHEKSIIAAVGYGAFPIVLEVLRSTMHDDEEKSGLPNWAQLFFVMAPLVVNAYVCLTNMEIANTVTTICGAYNVVTGIWYFLDTENAGRTWVLKGEADPIVVGLMALAQGVDIVKLLGYSWIPIVLNIAYETFITKAVDAYGLNKSLYLTWMILGAAVIGTLAFDSL